MDIPVSTRATTRTRPESLRHSRTWDAGVPCIAEARDAVDALLSRAQLAPERRAVQDAQLVVSELVTNAVKHAPGPCALGLELSADGDELRITVTDTSVEPLRARPADPGRVGGHGLNLVNLLSDGLQVTPLPQGKRVAATVPLTGAHGG
ncbi:MULTISPECIES: ATP-binding protein [Streptomyces]|uniref:ATP-binding protein n=1 Tax=Streptomyces TaxID=1883 RepID=UPI0029A3468B|nr:ATP-binding protein [Streptomyces sp. WI03-4A]MDX2592618.1 ATP-binding protein [Streptomyces sp. WI03-4A]